MMARTDELNETLRVAFEMKAGDDPVNAQVLGAIRTIEQKAAVLREQEYTPSQIRNVLEEEIGNLRAGVGQAYGEQAENYRAAVEERKAELLEERRKRSGERTAELLDVQNRFAGMSGEELREAAESYMGGASEYSLEELNAISAGLKQAGDDESVTLLRKFMKDRRANEWWLNDEVAGTYDSEANRLASTKPGEVSLEHEGQTFNVDVGQLVDLDGALDQEA